MNYLTCFVVIRTNGGTLNVGTSESVAKGQIYHYGVLNHITVYTENDCFHTCGAIGNMRLKAGKAIAEKGGIVYLTNAVADENKTVEVVENQGKFVIPAGVTTSDVPQAVVNDIGYTTDTVVENSYDNSLRPNSSYKIGSLNELEYFRDIVNNGFSFAGCTVELTADIKLNDGWTPIGEGSRDVNFGDYVGSYNQNENAVGACFAGTFKGNNHTITNLNAKGYSPKLYSIDNDHEVFVFGFFGILNDGTYITGLKFDDVDIDLSENIARPQSATSQKYASGDSVAALAGYAVGKITIENITVNGEIKASDSVAGILGRFYKVLNGSIISGCVNNANITTKTDGSGVKAAGIVGYCDGKDNTVTDRHLLLDGNTNTGNISGGRVSGIVLMASNMSFTITNNSNSGIITTYNQDAVSYIAHAAANPAKTVTASGNTNTGRAYVQTNLRNDCLLVYNNQLLWQGKQAGGDLNQSAE